ncbi:MAG: cupin [Rhodospirillaceae bacterium]|nr:cupin [Rhodospirillaceae bacterium]|tara:strand:- start:3780 stop:5012 length:1233 start_codon:yes stop_codon:yes gene_type:complete
MPHDIAGAPHWHEPNGDLYAGSPAWQRRPTPYDTFMSEQEIPIVRDISIPCLQNVALGNWKRMGGRGAFIQLFGTEGLWGSYLVEVPKAGALKTERHIYEKVVFVLEGRGTTEIWINEEKKPELFEWEKGSLFAIPLNARHKIVNSSNTPALLLAGTSAPNVFNLFDDEDIIFNSTLLFQKRFNPDEKSFKTASGSEEDCSRGLAMRRTNIIPNIFSTELYKDNRRTPGYRRIEPKMANNKFYQYISEYPPGRYSRAYYPGEAAVFLSIAGQGYCNTWPEDLGPTPGQNGDADQVMRLEYEAVGMISACPIRRIRWFHQHFNCSEKPLRILAWYGPNNHRVQQAGVPGEFVSDEGVLEVNKPGGTSIPYWMEDPAIREEFELACSKNGAKNQMENRYYDKHTTWNFSSGG